MSEKTGKQKVLRKIVWSLEKFPIKTTDSGFSILTTLLIALLDIASGVLTIMTCGVKSVGTGWAFLVVSEVTLSKIGGNE